MKRTLITTLSLIALLLTTTAMVSAQLRLPRPSPKASVMQTIGVTDVTITYSRPAVKGRKIWGEAPANSYAKGEATLDDSNKRTPDMPIVPYGHMWRTGANEATQFVVTDDVMVNGQPLGAGTYSLHTIPGKDEWTIIFNGNANQWGSFNYDPKNDTLRIKTKPETVADNQEMMEFTIEPTAENSAQVAIRWEKVRVPFTVEVKDVPSLALAKARIAVAGAKPTDWQIPFNAANYAKANRAPDDAAKWFDQSLRAIDEQIKAKSDFQNLARKASILAAAGRTQEAIAAGEIALAAGKAEKADTSALEKRIADMKAGKM